MLEITHQCEPEARAPDSPATNQSDRLAPRAIVRAHMHIAPPRITRHQRQRFALWLLTMLVWLAAVLDGAVDGRRARRRQTPLDDLARWVKQLILLRAMERVRVRPARAQSGRGGALPAHARRRAFGSRLRRALRRRDRRARIAALIHALRTIDAYASRLAKRLARGLTRLRPRIWRCVDEMRAYAIACAPLVADSS
jgi:hypothetical protein